MFQAGLFSFITTQSSITAQLGTVAARTAASQGKDKTTGVFPMLAIPEALLPYVTYQRISGSTPRTLQGENALQSARFRFSCYGASQMQATAVAEALKLLLASWTGTLPDGTVVQNVMYEFEADGSEPLPHGTVFATHVDYTFMWVDNGN